MLIYKTLIHSHLTYQPMIYAWRTNSCLRSLQAAQSKALKIVHNLPTRYPSLNLYRHISKDVLPIYGLYKQQISIYMFKSLQGIGSGSTIFSRNIAITGRHTRQGGNIAAARCRLDITKQRIKYSGPSIYNSLPVNIKNTTGISSFKKLLKDHLLQNLETLLI